MVSVLLSILLVVLPVFLVIGAGYCSVRLGVMQDAVVGALMTFATRIAVPTLLFTKMSSLDLAAVFNADMMIAFYTGALSAGGLAYLAARLLGVDGPQSVVIGFAALFSNTVLIGLPVMQRAYGPLEAETMIGLISIHAPMLLTLGMVAMAMNQPEAHEAGKIGKTLMTALRSTAQNALLIGIALGLLVNVTGFPKPAPIAAALQIVADSALPTALFALGAALTRYSMKAEIGWASAVVGFSLFLHPGVAYALGTFVFELEPLFLRAAVVAAAMPSGLNVYVFASLHRTGEGVAASSVVLGTATAVLSVSFWLAVLGGAA